ncbi:unnamed protein product [Jaminaea pallidilutea]
MYIAHEPEPVKLCYLTACLSLPLTAHMLKQVRTCSLNSNRCSDASQLGDFFSPTAKVKRRLELSGEPSLWDVEGS